MKNKFTFKNEYGEFELLKGEKHDLTIVDVNSGEAIPIFGAEIVKETKDDIVFKQHGEIGYIKKSIIAHEDLVSDTN